MSDVSPAVAFLHDEIARLRAENERLREASSGWVKVCLRNRCRQPCSWCQARAALGDDRGTSND
jgi:hypothetical protein